MKVSEIPCVADYDLLAQLESFTELDSQLSLGRTPYWWRILPFRLDLPQRQIDKFSGRLITWEVALVADRLAYLAVQASIALVV